MNKKNKIIILSLFLTIITNNVFAETLTWFKDAVSYIGKPISETTSIYRKEGLVIIDVDKSYISYSNEASRLTETQKQITGEVEKNHGFVISFSACDTKTGIKLTEPISSATVKKYFDNTSELVSELGEIISFFDKSPEYKKASFGVSKSDQVYMGFKRKDDLIVEIQLSQQPHTLMLVAAEKCQG